MNPAPWKLRRALPAIAHGWHDFFHQPCDARICAAIRMTYALLVLIHLAVLYPDLDHWFTSRGVLPATAAREIANPASWSLLFLFPDTPAAVHVCFWMAAGNALALLVGFLPRINALFLFLWIASFQIRNFIITDGEDTLMRLLGFFLIWLPSGQCWSVNALIRRWWTGRAPDCSAPGWGLRLFQIEMAGMLFSAGLIKLSGESWFGGTALYYVARLDDHFGRCPVPAWMFDTPWVVAILTWSVLVVELGAPLLIWFRETRLPCLIALLIFHLGNEWTMNLFLFHWLMLCGWLSFLTPADFGQGRGRSPNCHNPFTELSAALPVP